MGSILLRSSETNAHPIDISSAPDLKRHLGEIDLSDEEIEKIADQFLYSTVKLEGVDTRAANLIKKYIESLGGGIAMRKEAHDYTVRETDVMDVRGSYEKLKAATGWAPEIPLERTLRDLLNWHRDCVAARHRR